MGSRCDHISAAPAPYLPQVRHRGCGRIAGGAEHLLLRCTHACLRRSEHLLKLHPAPAPAPHPPPCPCSDFEFLELPLLERELLPQGLPSLLLNKFLQLGKRAAAATAMATVAVVAGSGAAAAPKVKAGGGGAQTALQIAPEGAGTAAAATGS